MRVQAGIGLPRNGRTVGVTDRNHLCALLPGVADRHERVHGFTRLGQGNHQGFLVHNGVPVPELVGQLHLGGDTAPVFDRIPGHHAGIGGRATGDDNDLVNAAQHGLVDVQLIQRELAVLVEPAHQGVADSGRLIVDFLLHEGAEPALFRGGGIPLHLKRLALGLIASEINDVVAGGGDGDDLVVRHFHRILGVVNEPRHVGAEEVLALAQANDQRGIPAGGNNPIREICVQRQQRERTLQPVAGQPHGFGEVALAGAVHKVGQQGGGHLGVGFGLKGVALFQ